MAMILLTLAISGVILLANFGRITPIDGARMVTEVQSCTGVACTPDTPMTLPYFSGQQNDATLRSMTFRATLGQPDHDGMMQALYFPKFADHIGITLNGIVLQEMDIGHRQWVEPQLVEVPAALLEPGENTLDIVISGRWSEGLELFAFFIGPREALYLPYIQRFAFGPAFARFNLAFMGILGAVYLLIWLNRRADTRYLWLGLSCVCAGIVLLQFGYGFLIGGYKLWLSVSHLAVAFFALFIVKFVRIHLTLEELRLERTMLLALVCAMLAAVFIPPGQFRAWTLIVDLITAIASVAALTIFWIHRNRIETLDFQVIFACMAIAMGIGAHEMLMIHAPHPERSFHLFHFVPVCMSLVCLWVIVSQLVRSLRRYEVLTATLSDTIAQKTDALEKSFAQLARVEKREAVDRERNRIMLDLHDGIGGQLVSTLAYMESTGNKDETLKEALEAALRDLALVLDSLDSHDSLTTLLGMLRTRLEPLLSDHGLQFKWQIMDDPAVPMAGPSSNLHLARIVQEAITNVIKHADAKTITVYSDARTITISDDGVGIDPVCATPGACEGHGLAGMRQRAESMGARFDVTRTEQGTQVRLSFDQRDAVEQTPDLVRA